jgi:hypothetical protein
MRMEIGRPRDNPPAILVGMDIPGANTTWGYLKDLGESSWDILGYSLSAMASACSRVTVNECLALA